MYRRSSILQMFVCQRDVINFEPHDGHRMFWECSRASLLSVCEE